MYKVSNLFWPVLTTPQNAVVKNVELLSRSQKLMTELGLIKSASNGTYCILPIAQRAIDKVVELINHGMRQVNGQKLSLPILTPAALWNKTGRLQGEIKEFFLLRDRHDKSFLLSPTHEEAITAMLASIAPISYRQLPLRLYQIGPKFRDELKARFGLLRAKEFLMKDLYTFDRTMAESKQTYEEITKCYDRFFGQLEIPIMKVEASTGIMGGSVSHEYHILSEIGEDGILQCSNCGYAMNEEVSQTASACPKCEKSTLKMIRGIEVGHCFLLGDRYSKTLKATFLNDKGKPEPTIMGCYGIGLTRLLAASLDVLSTEEEIRWPALLAPFDVCVIGPKEGSKEQSTGDEMESTVCRSLIELCGLEAVLQDDRKQLTIGKRLYDAKRMGYPLIIVIGSKCTLENPQVELHMRDKSVNLDMNEALTEVANYNHRKAMLLDRASSGAQVEAGGMRHTLVAA